MNKNRQKLVCVLPHLKKANYYLLFLVIIPIIFQSCQLEPNPSGNEVNVQTLNFNGFQLERGLDFYMSIGEYPEQTPDYRGICLFRDVAVPYDLKAGRSWHVMPYVFKNITNLNPVLILPRELYDEGKFRTLIFSVSFPDIEQGKIGILKFISKDLLDSAHIPHLYNIYVITSGNYCIREIKIPMEKTSITGRLIFLEGIGHYNHELGTLYFDTYDYYGTKEVTFQSEVQNYFTFTPEEIGYNPAESSVEISASYPAGAVYKRLRVFLDFGGYHSNSKMLIADFGSPHSAYTVKVPLIPDLPCKINALSGYLDMYYWEVVISNPFESVYIEPGTSINITHKMIDQVSPVNGKTGVTGNDNLTVKEDGEKGVYVFYISATGKPGMCRVVTDKNSIRLGELNYKEFKLVPATTYGWHVLKLSAFGSIDEFLSKPYIFEREYNSVKPSETWYFETAP